MGFENNELIFSASNTIYYLVKGIPSGSDGKITGSFVLYGRDNDTYRSGSWGLASTHKWTVVSSSGKSQSNPKKVYISDTTGLTTKKTYLINESGLPDFYFQCREISANTYVISNYDLEFDYTTNARIYDTHLSCSITIGSASSDIYNSYKGLWKYYLTGSSNLSEDIVLYDICRHDTETPPLTVEEVYQRFDNLSDYVRPNLFELDKKIQFAWNEVKAMLRRDRIDPRLVRNLDIFDSTTYYQLLLDLCELGIIPSGWNNDRETYRRNLISDRNHNYELASQNITWYDTDNDDETIDSETNMFKCNVPMRY